MYCVYTLYICKQGRLQEIIKKKKGTTMGWVTLTLRKLSLTESIQNGEMQNLNYSRRLRGIQRQLSFDKTVVMNDRQEEIELAKEDYDDWYDKKPEKTNEDGTENEDYDKDYEEWSDTLRDKSEEYQDAKLDIETTYDIVLQNIEEAATELETDIQEQQTTLEANLESWRSELESINETISSDIKSSTIKLGS